MGEGFGKRVLNKVLGRPDESEEKRRADQENAEAYSTAYKESYLPKLQQLLNDLTVTAKEHEIASEGSFVKEVSNMFVNASLNEKAEILAAIDALAPHQPVPQSPEGFAHASKSSLFATETLRTPRHELTKPQTVAEEEVRAHKDNARLVRIQITEASPDSEKIEKSYLVAPISIARLIQKWPASFRINSTVRVNKKLTTVTTQYRIVSNSVLERK